MQQQIEPYLALLQRELATSLRPKDDDNAKRISIYLSRMLTQMLLRGKTLPALQREAIAELDAILDELNGRLRAIASGMVITADLMLYTRITPDFYSLQSVLQSAVHMLLTNTDDSGKILLKKILAILCRLEEGLHQATLSHNAGLSGEQVDIAPPLTELQWRILQEYFRSTFAEPELEIKSLNPITGGGSKKTLIVRLRYNRTLPDVIVVRADQATGVVESTVSDEYRLLETLYEEGLPVPRPYALESDGSIIGGAFIVVGFIEGSNIGDQADVFEPSRNYAAGLARAMGKLHRIPPEHFGERIPGACLSTLEQVRGEIDTFEMMWRNSRHPSVVLELAYAWLKEHLNLAEGRRALNHCDLACHNILAKDGELTAILDWETTLIGNPTRDLAYVYPQMIQCMPWEGFLAEYARAGGTVPTSAEFDFYRLWTQCWRMSYVCVARSFFRSGSGTLVHAYGAQHLEQRHGYELNMTLNDIYRRY